MRYAGKAVCLVMCNGDIIVAYEDDEDFNRTDEDTEFFTSEGDTLTYGDVISAIDAMYANQDDDPEEDDEDSNEDDSNSDENGAGFDMGDDPDYYF